MKNASSESLAERWIAIALAYFVAAVALGVVMGAAHDFRLRSVHVHLNMLGWVSMSLFGLLLRAFPQVAASRLARAQFWLYQAALPIMMSGLTGLMLGYPQAEPIVGLGSVGVGVAVLLFALALWRRDRGPSGIGLKQQQAVS